MQPVDTAALEADAWRGFVAQLGAHLAGRWPAMPERLAERYPAFVELAAQQALDSGLRRAPSVARLVNLWFVWGPAFHDKPGFEWAAALLASVPQHEWLAVHQLVQRSLLELARLPGARIEPQALAAADAGVLQAFGGLGRQGLMRPADPLPSPAAACDLDAADIRLIDDGWHQQYRLSAGADWQRAALAWPAALRVDARHPCPKLVAALSHLLGQGPQARLQVRVRPLLVCNGDLHPALGFSGPHGRWDWAGHAAKAASWPLAAREQALPAAGPGTAIAEETSPELHRLDIETCGLRDSGEVLGPQQATVSVWPAAQWWIELQRAQPSTQALLPGPQAWAKPPTRCRVERDGLAQDSAALRRQFEAGLDGATARALQSLASAWQQSPGLVAASFDAQLGLLVGQASLSWGWHFGPGGLDGPALMRVLGQLALDACQADLQLVAELAPPADHPSGLAGTRSRLSLRLAGQAPLKQALQREGPLPALADVLGAAVAQWRFPAVLTIEPLATDSGRLLQQAGPATGALVGEAGLRPRTTGGSGWEWFANLRIEPVAVPVAVTDPLLGGCQLSLPLLPAMTLLAWSLG